MRELTRDEVEAVSGGVFNLGSGIAGAAIGGLSQGGAYAIQSSRAGNFSWGRFATTTATSAVSGFLMGTGAGIMYSAATGAMRGAAPLGASMAGAGAAMNVSQGAMGGGSDNAN